VPALQEERTPTLVDQRCPEIRLRDDELRFEAGRNWNGRLGARVLLLNPERHTDGRVGQVRRVDHRNARIIQVPV
jgi:hypothetical protein